MVALNAVGYKEAQKSVRERKCKHAKEFKKAHKIRVQKSAPA